MTAAHAARDGQPGAGHAIVARGVVKRFGEITAVAGVDLAIEEGELFGLLGPNGAGKTTLVRMLTGLLPLTDGEAYVAGVDVRRHPDAARRALGVVPQALTSDLDLTGQENLDVYARFFGVPARQRRSHRPTRWSSSSMRGRRCRAGTPKNRA